MRADKLAFALGALRRTREASLSLPGFTHELYRDICKAESYLEEGLAEVSIPVQWAGLDHYIGGASPIGTGFYIQEEPHA